jgi:hypothetical protein
MLALVLRHQVVYPEGIVQYVKNFTKYIKIKAYSGLFYINCNI